MAGVLPRVGGDDLAGVDVVVGVARDVGGDHVRLHLACHRVAVRDEEVVLVVLAVRWAAGLDLEDVGVAVQVGGQQRQGGLHRAHERLRLRRGVGDHVAVLVEPERSRPRAGRTTIGVEREREVDPVVTQQVAHLGVRRRDEVLDDLHGGVGALPLVAVDVGAEPHRLLVGRRQPLARGRLLGVVLDEATPVLLEARLLLRLRCGDGHEVEVATLGRPADDLGGDAVALAHPLVEQRRQVVVGQQVAGVGGVRAVGVDLQRRLEGVRRRHLQRLLQPVGAGCPSPPRDTEAAVTTGSRPRRSSA